jgi:hypothetical protein
MDEAIWSSGKVQTVLAAEGLLALAEGNKSAHGLGRSQKVRVGLGDPKVSSKLLELCRPISDRRSARERAGWCLVPTVEPCKIGSHLTAMANFGANLTPQAACEALRGAGLTCSPERVQIVAREERWALWEAYPVDSGLSRCSMLSDWIGAVARADADGEGAVARGIPKSRFPMRRAARPFYLSSAGRMVLCVLAVASAVWLGSKADHVCMNVSIAAGRPRLRRGRRCIAPSCR